MDTEARIDQALAKVAVVRERALEAREAGPPCTGCRYLSERLVGFPKKPTGFCAHLTYANWAFDPASGKTTETHDTLTTTARSVEGLCGPEAALFEKRRFFNKQSMIGIAIAAPGLIATADIIRRLAGY